MNTSNILLFSDDLNMQQVVEIILEQAGYEIAHVPSYTVLHREADLILIDFEKEKEKLYMELTITAKALIPVFILCTENMLKSAEKCRADKYIIKPFEIAEFINPIKDILNPVLKKIQPVF